MVKVALASLSLFFVWAREQISGEISLSFSSEKIKKRNREINDGFWFGGLIQGNSCFLSCVMRECESGGHWFFSLGGINQTVVSHFIREKARERKRRGETEELMAFCDIFIWKQTTESFFSFLRRTVHRNSKEMDDAMTDVPEVPFEAQEIDLDYEFDAPQFFDFTRPESSEDAQEAECWFESAESYSPSRKHFKNKFLRLKVDFFFLSIILSFSVDDFQCIFRLCIWIFSFNSRKVVGSVNKEVELEIVRISGGRDLCEQIIFHSWMNLYHQLRNFQMTLGLGNICTYAIELVHNIKKNRLHIFTA